MLLLAPVVALDLALLTRAIVGGRSSTPQVGGAFGLAAVYFLAMLFFHIFTTIYDYASVVGLFFRDRFWFVYLLAGIGLAMPVLLVRKEEFTLRPLESARPAAAPGLLAVGTIVVLALTTPRPLTPVPKGEIKIMTYNIQQGYDQAGAKNLDGQLAVIQKIDPDILGLQESDTARIANGNVDVVRYFADRLGMHSYYGPTTTTGTFGIALLSKYPIEAPGTFFMYSEGEQTATIQARIAAGGQDYNLFVTHLGNHGPIVQLEDILQRIRGLENVVAVGDYNFRPETEQYELVTQTLADAWLMRWPGGKPISGYAPEKRIDHIFVSPGIEVLEAEYVVDPASDHPYMYAVIQP
jgi:endonuclease/exonuclease/phosphatase family metal-dependent hydrolase